MVRQLVQSFLDGTVNDREMESRTASEQQRKRIGNDRGNVNPTEFHERSLRGWTKEIDSSTVLQFGFVCRSIFGPDFDTNLAKCSLVLVEPTLELIDHVHLF